ncbi:AI-2E family transporter [Bordetella genomosp. 12]|uniref:AI-2E family transporter n=1 Tax=Bordetella genomosp. 12 TaxID=463035 RepID=A0A261VBH1_9BORD|nr:AI-2E family transporter [Bordetella genomosp. 12]OZI71111.1 AI-2E family transporter [Bordetella genomosp. 12]
MRLRPNVDFQQVLSRSLLDLFIRISLIGGLVYWCYRVAEPFIGLLLWSIILAITLAPLHHRITRWLGGRPKSASLLLVILTLLAFMIPGALLASSLAESLRKLFHQAEGQPTLRIPDPPSFISNVPLIGDRLHDAWMLATQNVEAALKPLQPVLTDAAKWLLNSVTTAGMEFLVFLAAVAIAGLVLVYDKHSKRMADDIAGRIAGAQRGHELVQLIVTTIRAVAQGVIGVALIQAALSGLGMLVAGVPGAGIWAIVALAVCIVQLPIFIVLLPATIYVFMTNSTTMGVAFAIWSVLVSLVDNILKPLMLARGISIPLPIILIGALGGVVAAGIVGLFLGPVGFALGYVLFMQWVRDPLVTATPEITSSDDSPS